MGADPIDLSGYSFIQSPACNYEETQTLSGAPAFVVIDPVTK
jgi:hypothetical protein